MGGLCEVVECWKAYHAGILRDKTFRGGKYNRGGVDEVESQQQVQTTWMNNYTIYAFHIWSDDVLFCVKPKAYGRGGNQASKHSMPTEYR